MFYGHVFCPLRMSANQILLQYANNVAVSMRDGPHLVTGSLRPN